MGPPVSGPGCSPVAPATDTGPGSQALADLVSRLREQVARRARAEGRTDAPLAGLRYYRFSQPQHYRKIQRLMPGLVVVLQGRKSAALAGRELHYDAGHCLVLRSEALCHGTVVSASADRPYLAIHLDLPPEMLLKTLMLLPSGLPERAGRSDQSSQASRASRASRAAESGRSGQWGQSGRPDAVAPTASASRLADEAYVAPVDPAVLLAFERLLPALDDALDCLSIAPLIVEEIVVRLLRSDAAGALRSAAAVSRSAARIHQSMQRMRGRLAQRWTVDELAREAAMSPSHYAHCFRAVAGMSPMRCLGLWRLDAARALLAQGGMRPAEAAQQLGFDSAAHFTREFKRRFEVTPAAFQRGLAAGAAQAAAANEAAADAAGAAAGPPAD